MQPNPEESGEGAVVVAEQEDADLSAFAEPGDASRKFGTFTGVFRPTILTILGVMMYLREGWLVGNAGLLGAVGVILCCYAITGATALSISSITTNIRVGSGGVFSIISQSLGLEVGGSFGIPLYLAQGLSAALYLQGIVEIWQRAIFPDHSPYLVKLAAFMACFLLSFVGAKLAFRVQVVVMLGTVMALVSMFLGLRGVELAEPVMWGGFEDAGFWALFAVFFPAATGIMVGSSMSGNLKNPRRSIPRGTLAAWAVSGLVYLSIAVWYSFLGDGGALRDTETRIFAVEHAAWGSAVLIGVLASCFTAALSSLVAAPRVLQALGAYEVVPFHRFFSKTQRDEPRNASLFTGAMALAALMAGDFNAIAQVLTIFFLVIYFMINFVLLIEQSLQMISFRPTFRVPSWTPLIGSLFCLTAILIISPLVGLFAIAFIMGLYYYLDHKQLQTPWETVHSGLFASIASWAAKKVASTAKTSARRSWKPDLLIPVRRTAQLSGYYRLVRALTHPHGNIHVAGFDDLAGARGLRDLHGAIDDLKHEGVYATASVIESKDFLSGLRTCISVHSGAFFRPNTLFTSIDNRSQEELDAMAHMARENRMGVVFLAIHPESGLGRERTVNLWVRDQSPNWHLGLKLTNLDYAVLMSYQLKVNWRAKVRMITVVKDRECEASAREFLSKLVEYARLTDIEIIVAHGDFWEYLVTAPKSDLNIMGLPENVQRDTLVKIIETAGASCMFVRDSGEESALA